MKNKRIKPVNCPSCDCPLEFNKSGFEQYQNSTWDCPCCGNAFSTDYVKGRQEYQKIAEGIKIKTLPIVETWVSKGEMKRIQIMNPELFDQVAKSLGYLKAYEIEVIYSPHKDCIKRSQEECWCITDYLEYVKNIIKESSK